MTTQEIANRLVACCRQGDWATAQNELYADNAVSIEPTWSPNPRTEGLDAIKAKGEAWDSMVSEYHGGKVSDPVVTDNWFSITMESDVTFKEQGRMQIKEICVYNCKDGKVVSEQFFYDQMG